MAEKRVFIPVPSDDIVRITQDPGTKEFKAAMANSWYLFFSRRLAGPSQTSVLLDGADFGIDQSVIAAKAFQPHVTMLNQTTWGDKQNILAGQIFGP